MIVPLHSSIGDRLRLCLKPIKKKESNLHCLSSLCTFPTFPHTRKEDYTAGNMVSTSPLAYSFSHQSNKPFFFQPVCWRKWFIALADNAVALAMGTLMGFPHEAMELCGSVPQQATCWLNSTQSCVCWAIHSHSDRLWGMDACRAL